MERVEGLLDQHLDVCKKRAPPYVQLAEILCKPRSRRTSRLDAHTVEQHVVREVEPGSELIRLARKHLTQLRRVGAVVHLYVRKSARRPK